MRCLSRDEVSLKLRKQYVYEVLRELLREARQFKARELRVLASSKVIDMFLDEESQSLANLSDFIWQADFFVGGADLQPRESFDIILM